MTNEKRIEIRWRDLDALRHVNNAVYATYLEEARDEWMNRALGGAGDLWDYVLVRVAIDFRRELTQDDDAVVVRTRLTRIGAIEPHAPGGDRDAGRHGRSGGGIRRGRARPRDGSLAAAHRRRARGVRGGARCLSRGV